MVRILDKNPKTGETQLRTAAVMKKGTSFGVGLNKRTALFNVYLYQLRIDAGGLAIILKNRPNASTLSISKV